jgi:hypothetical protein
MTNGIAIENGGFALSSRPAAFSSIDRCLELQSAGRPRGWFARQIGSSPVVPAARASFADAIGELEVARALAALPSDWKVLHSVPLGRRVGVVDHLLIGPAGVFTVSTRAVSGHVWVGRTRILVDGHREELVTEAERQARRVHRQLREATGSSVFVRPVLVFVASRRVSLRDAPASVTVTTSADLVAWLADQARVYPTDRVAELVEAARRDSTWLVGSDSPADPRRQLQRFERLTSEVAEADRRRGWTRLAAVLAGTALVAAAIAITLPMALVDAATALIP